MQYVKKKDGTIVESQCETIKVTENTLTKVLQGKINASDFFVGYTGNDLTDILEYDATKNITNMDGMFNSCRNLTTVPLFDTSKVKDMSNMFIGCESIESVPQFNTPAVTNTVYMFSGCKKLITVPLFNTSNVTNMNSMFEGCWVLKEIPKFDTSKVTRMSNMFYNCDIVTVPLLDTSNVTNISAMFFSCNKLKEIPQFDFSKATIVSSIFYNCSNLEEIHCTGLKLSFDISASTKFTESALVEILNNLGTPTTSQTLTMGATNLAKLTDEEKAIATDKGWTLK